MKKSKVQPAGTAVPSRNRFRLDGCSVTLDRRVHAVRKDLADVSLAGTLFAPHYARAIAMTCTAAGTMVHDMPSADSVAVTQLLHGETFHVLDVTGDWAWGFCGHDGYVGYVRAATLAGALPKSSHRITLSAPVFSEPGIKSAIREVWPIGALCVGSPNGTFVETSSGYVHTRHIEMANVRHSDAVSVAERYIGLPYVWGGRGHGGIDCSGLVQVALAACGHVVPRDTDMQRDSIGGEIAADAPLQRGDIIFFPGHVGFMADSETLLHANAHWMAVVAEPLADVIARLHSTHEQPVLARRRIRT